jgi:two-component system LytT family response regulator
MLRCIAIDDEDLALELLEDNISRVPFLQLVAKSGNPIEAIGCIQREKPDLVFLDIQMPGLTGLQVIQSLPNKPMFIFVTAYEKYALDGFKLNVVDYLVKPVALERFVEACNKALELHQLKNKPAEPVRGTEPAYFFINSEYSHIKLTFADIVFVEGLKDYIKIHLKSSKPIVVRLSMKGIEEQLPSSSFLRIQKSYIVSKDSITAIRKNSVFIGSTELPIGDNYKEAVYSLLGIQPQ